MKRVLLVDSNQESCAPARERLLKEGYDVLECQDGAHVLRTLRAGVDAIVVCAAFEDESAIALLRRARGEGLSAPWILVASSPAEMVEAFREGAYYVTRSPLVADEISVLLERALAKSGGKADRALASEETAVEFVGDSPAIRAIREAVRRVSLDALLPVLVAGERGAGKRSVVKLLHEEEGAERPFISWSAESAIEEPFEAALGRAQGGTLFLSEITLLPVPFQLKLLETLKRRDAQGDQAHGAHAKPTRICATSSLNLQDAVRDGALLPELASRVAMARLDLAPLRERLSDIPLLVDHFCRQLAASGRCKKLKGVTDAAMACLMKYEWPGNVRELSNALEGAALLSDAEYLDANHFQSLSSVEPELKYQLPSQGIDFRELEREVLVQALRKTAGNQTRAALLLGLTRDQIRYRMAKFGMSSREAGRLDDHAA